MSQEAVERLLGRLLTDDQFRKQAEKSIEGLCRKSGYDLNASELSVIGRDDIIRLGMVSLQLDRNIKRS
ncbi:MAG: Os1348 family NHLP clan protein [Desulfuromonadaceae bacterium]|nr:Os1348 family NHLP clan protein [Desulfuromonadaceae bacterium]MDD2847776.1 Os1348 family NHLP clan protein [Desulfuromonadaceae bacterium]MDD4129679.1 Os1348 family NHLP clan protein [Desulfuromonadaceae bacterium]